MKPGLLFIALMLLLTSCAKKNYITLTNREEYYPEKLFEKTPEEVNSFSVNFFTTVMLNTIGKDIPEIEVTDLEGRKYNLQKLLSHESIIIASDAHCGYGDDGVTNVFPKAVQQINLLKGEINIICLIVKSRLDNEYPERIDNLSKSAKSNYKAVYLIDEKEAKKLNLYANPTRLYITNSKVVKNMVFGTGSVEDMIIEIKSNTILTN